MKIRIPIVLFFMVAILAHTLVSPGMATAATRDTPNWLNGNAQYVEGTSLDTSPECNTESVMIAALPNHVYANNGPIYDVVLGGTRHLAACVYHADGYSYTSYSRSYYANPLYPNAGGFTETGVAVSFGDEQMFKYVNKFEITSPDSHIYLGKTKGFLRYSVGSHELRYYKDVKEHISVRQDGILELEDSADLLYKDSRGIPLAVGGIGVSQNKKWISFGVENFGIVKLNLDTLEPTRVSDRYVVQGWTWPTPVISTSISNDGGYLAVGGSGYQTEVIVTGQCGSHDSFVSTTGYPPGDTLGSQSCPYVNLSSITWNNSQSVGNNGNRMVERVTVNASGGMFSYWDEYKWNTIYAPNSLTPGQLYYLALGDSYASGEGDVTLDGGDHYLAGTNVYGNYNSGIPR